MKYDYNKMLSPQKNYCQHLLESLGLSTSAPNKTHDTFLQDWASSGLMYLIGDDEQPFLAENAVPSCANQTLKAFNHISNKPLDSNIRGAKLLTERAAYLNLKAQGKTSANGTCHLLPCRDEWLAFNLAREEDWLLLPALFQTTHAINTIADITLLLKNKKSKELIERAHLLGLPLALLPSKNADQKTNTSHWFKVLQQGLKQGLKRTNKQTNPLVIDLSSLWAGPLCSHLLQQTGARVIKVESKQRPDSVNIKFSQGHHDFYDLLNKNKEHLTLDFKSSSDIQHLKTLIENADIVIEGSRPRALQQLGIYAKDFVATIPGLIWLSITAYGREEPQANWLAFGDDAAMAAGLFHNINQQPAFVGDAIADPLAGIHAALAAQTFWQQGKGALLDINLMSVARHCVQFEQKNIQAKIIKEKKQFFLVGSGEKHIIQKPQIRATSSTSDLFYATH